MKVGDKVIINPNIPDGTWSKHGYGFHHSAMLKPGIFTLEDEDAHGSFNIEKYIYDEEWLLPVPLYNIGDTVTIRKDLSKEDDDIPYGVNEEMENLGGSTYTVTGVKFGDREPIKLGDDGYLYSLKESGSWGWSSPMFDLKNYKLKFKSNESRLQEQESPLRRGSGEVKCGVCCRKHKPRVTIKSVGYKEVIGRG